MTFLRTVNSIELSSICTLSCKYCINRLLRENGRTPKVMPDDIFEASIGWLEKFVDLGTQQEVNVFNIGESTTDPDFIKRVKRIREVVGSNSHLILGTNGTTMTPKLADELAFCGLDWIDVSPHDALAARMAVDMLIEAGAPVHLISDGAIKMPHNFCDQIDPIYHVKVRGLQPLCPIPEGRAYIDSDGFVSPCCFDAFRKGTIGHVFDIDLDKRELEPFELCQTCHLRH